MDDLIVKHNAMIDKFDKACAKFWNKRRKYYESIGPVDYNDYNLLDEDHYIGNK